MAVTRCYQLPPLDLLSQLDPATTPPQTREELMANARLVQQTLAQFDIEVALGDITRGPTLTRYELHVAPGVRLEEVAGYSSNLAAALKAESIRILTPMPGKSSVGIEVPNAVKATVIMRDLLATEEWRTTQARIPLVLGADVSGRPILADLTELHHLLVAGDDASEKSAFLDSDGRGQMGTARKVRESVIETPA
jgi:DNA segregation ATPase FtsK/SpoIIIE, S-DNA-T family